MTGEVIVNRYPGTRLRLPCAWYSFRMNKARRIVICAVPILLMIGLIPLVRNDYALTLLYIGIIVLALLVHRRKYDVIAFFVGFVLMTVAEYLFILTGVEIFLRNTLFGVMPLWLPFLWGYGFVSMKHIEQIVSRKD